MCNYVGYDFEHIKLDEIIDIDELLNVIDELNNDNSVNGKNLLFLTLDLC